MLNRCLKHSKEDMKLGANTKIRFKNMCQANCLSLIHDLCIGVGVPISSHCIRNSKQLKFRNPEIQNERRRLKCKQQMSALWGKPSILQNIFLTKWIMNHWTLFTCINNLQVQIKPAKPLHFQQMLMRSHSQKLHLAWQNVSFFVTSEVSPQFISCANRLRF